ncbi:hypothetical protein AVEN_145635-1, partial [Araneus ventricosus]
WKTDVCKFDVRLLARGTFSGAQEFFYCMGFPGNEKEELQGMLPVDGRQLENVKGELLKLKKKEAADCPTMAERGQDRRAEETEEQRNSRLSAMVQHAR